MRSVVFFSPSCLEVEGFSPSATKFSWLFFIKSLTYRSGCKVPFLFMGYELRQKKTEINLCYF